ncbi:hypothetical protein J5W01_00520 [Akkermansia muciniphila]|uniref:hypothetical protein n=1 Tax=Akkermansia sp. TaxID=1872421 RepID=UPI001C01AE85|nr:hypothetical protein [Candidatus Akkermansia timonensis]MBT9561440.1 hypothetical protein [Candidatus Akkermansia timonensis]MBT9599701.1 hypothetical protein [Akkermansia muciniphila]DAI93477.1 MAG TPA: hypothetical protein [Caudoviricetes sp.]
MNNTINIENIDLASALLAATAPIARRAEIIVTDRGERKVFYFTDTPETREMIKKWNDPDFVKNNPEDPFALVKATLDCRRNILAGLPRFRKIACIRSKDGEKVALIPENCPQEDKMEILGRLNS